MEFKFHFEIGQSYCSIWRTELLHILIFPSVLSLIFMQRSSDAGATRGMKHLRGLTFQFMPPTGLNLSQGTLKRLLLSLAWLAHQEVLLLDEPFDGLDLRQVRGVTLSLRDLTRCGRSLLLSIHQLRDAERSCDRFVLLNSGGVVVAGTLPELQVKIGRPDANLEDVFYALV